MGQITILEDLRAEALYSRDLPGIAARTLAELRIKVSMVESIAGGGADEPGGLEV